MGKGAERNKLMFVNNFNYLWLNDENDWETIFISLPLSTNELNH